jgi:hypothetical protein
MNPSVVTIPAWLISMLVSLFVSALVVWGGLTAARAGLEVRMKRNEQDIRDLWEEKVSMKEMNLIMEKLDDIKRSLEKHIEKDQK